jgi:uncharacterized membrane protein YfcA
MDYQILILCAFAFSAGMVDAAVGGGGLIQIPALFSAFPSAQAATLFGTNKLASICGSSVAARSYFGKVHVAWSLVLPAALSAFVMGFLGAAAVSYVPQNLMRPMVLVLVIAMAIYTFIKKDFGKIQRATHIGKRERVLSVVIGGAIGFYDGIFGPGTGSFLIFLFIRYFSFDFLQASAAAKVVNIATNLAALLYFVPSGNVLYAVAIPMAIFNMMGGWVGSRVAMKHGAGLIRVLFLFLLVILIFKLAYGIVSQN